MTEKTITITSLQNLLDNFFEEKNAEQKNRKSNSWILDKAGNATFILNENISITISIYLNSSNVRESDGESIHIKGLSILGEQDQGALSVNGCITRINEFVFEEVDFCYSKNDGFIIPSRPLIISTYNCTVVKLINCTTKNNTPLRVKHNMLKKTPPTGYPKKNELIIKNCKFKHLDIIANSLKDASSSMSVIGKGKSELSYGTPTINLHMDFNGNFLQKLILDLYKSPSDEYKYSYSAKLINENDIEEFIIKDECPDVLAWGTQERIGARIAKDYYTKSNDNQVWITRLKKFIYHLRKRGTLKSRGGFSGINQAWKTLNNNKIVFMKFKKIAADKGDRFQESTINYHIAKCDDQFMSLEQHGRFLEDKLIMAFGRGLSYHGTSWALPLIWIIIFNLATALIIFVIIKYGCSSMITDISILHIFGELFNPFNTPTSVVESIDENLKYKALGGLFAWMFILVILSKGFYAMCIYEFVRVARRFTLK